MDFQIGKNGITPEVIETLERHFQTHKQIRIYALKASGRDKESIGQMALEIADKLSIPTVHKVIGFTIIMSKGRGAKKPKQ